MTSSPITNQFGRTTTNHSYLNKVSILKTGSGTPLPFIPTKTGTDLFPRRKYVRDRFCHGGWLDALPILK